MICKKYFAIFLCVTSTLMMSFYCLDVADGIKDASNVVIDEFKLIEAGASDTLNHASNIVTDEFKLIEAKTSSALKYAKDTVVDVIQEIEAKSYGCQCADYSCGCCAHLEFPKIHLNDTGCVNLTYLVKDYGISFTVTIDNMTIYNETISAHDPPPVCFGVPYLEKYAELCVHFYDLDASRTKLHGCVDIEARLRKIVIGRYKVGCFNIGKSTLGLWKKYHLQLVKKIRSKQKKLSDNLFA